MTDIPVCHFEIPRTSLANFGQETLGAFAGAEDRLMRDRIPKRIRAVANDCTHAETYNFVAEPDFADLDVFDHFSFSCWDRLQLATGERSMQQLFDESNNFMKIFFT